MQKNPCRVDDPLQNPIDRESYEDAVSLEDGIYPITTDDNTIISSDMVKHGNGTVEDALNNLIHEISFNGTTDATGNLYISPNKLLAVGVEFTSSAKTGYCFIYGANGVNGTYLRVLSNGNALLTNTAVEGKVYYLSL